MGSVMNEILSFFINMAFIIGVAAAIYCIIWIAIFFPIVKLRKHKEKVSEYEREYNKIEVQFSAAVKAKQAADADVKTTLWHLHNLEKEIESKNKVLDQIEKDTKVAKKTK